MQKGGSTPALWRKTFGVPTVTYEEFCVKVQTLGSGIQLTPGDVAVALSPLDRDQHGGVDLSMFQQIMET